MSFEDSGIEKKAGPDNEPRLVELSASVVQSVEEEAQDRFERGSDLDLEVVISRNIISKKRSKKASFISEDVEEDPLSEEEEEFAPAAKKPKRTSPPQALSDQTGQLIKAYRTQSFIGS